LVQVGGELFHLEHGHAETLPIQYCSTASSAQKLTATFTEGGDHSNFSEKSISTPVSFCREKPISKYPAEFIAQRDASTNTTAVHFRSIVGGASLKIGPP
jgi:hypothetical protein